MSSDIFYDPEIFVKSYEEALKHNEQTLNKIRTFKKELEDVKTNLEQNQNHLYQNIMVPIGSKALIKGKLVHTNEVTINVGDRWFLKKSAAGAIQTCNRMIERCDLNLAEYEKEMNLLCSNLEAPKDYEIFASEGVQDIVEPYDEDEEKRWREQHREKVRQYRQQLATNKKNEDDVFEKLSKLEEEEESEDDDDDSFYDDDDDEIGEEEYKQLIEESIRLNEKIADSAVSEPEDPTIRAKFLSKRVSFSESLESTQEYSTSIDDDISVIQFKHSQNPAKNSQITNADGIVNSPFDMYKKYIADFDITRKSILKKSHSDEISSEKSILKKCQFDEILPDKSIQQECHLNEISDQVLGDIVERTPVVSTVENNPRPKSKFRLSRSRIPPLS